MTENKDTTKQICPNCGTQRLQPNEQEKYVPFQCHKCGGYLD